MSVSTAWREIEEEQSSSRGMYRGKKSASTVVRLRKEKVDETFPSVEDSASHRDAHRPRHLGLPLGFAAQRPGHVPRIAFLDLNYPPAVAEPTPLLDAFRQGSANMDGWRDTPSRLSGAGRRGV